MKCQRHMPRAFQFFHRDVLHTRIRRMPIRANRQRLPDHLLRCIAEARLRKSHSLRQLPEEPHIRSRLAARRNRLLRKLHKVVPVRSLHVGVLQKRRRRQHKIRVIGGVGKKLLVHHGEEIVALEAAPHRVRIRRHRSRIRVVHKQRMHRRAVVGTVLLLPRSLAPLLPRLAKLGQRLAKRRHIHHPRQPPQRRSQRQIGPLQCFFVPRKRARRRKLSSAAARLPCPRQRRQHRNRAHRRSAVLRALHAVIQPQRRGPRRRVLARQLLNLAGRHSGPSSHAFRSVFAHTLGQRFKAVRHSGNVGAVFQAFVENHVHQAQRQRHIRAGPNRDMPVRHGRGARAVGVNHDQPRTVAPRLLHKRPQVNVVAVDIRAPRQNQFRPPEIFGRRAEFFPVHQVPRLAARLGTNRAIELARAHAMKKSPIHRSVSQHANGSRVAVRQNRFRTVAIARLLEPRRNRVQRFIPAHTLESFVLAATRQRPLRHAGPTAHRIKNAVRRIHAIQIFRHLAAQEPSSHRL